MTFRSIRYALLASFTLIFLFASPTLHATASICDGISGNLITNCGFEAGVVTSTMGGFTNNSVPMDWIPNTAFDQFPSFNHESSNANSGTGALSIGNLDQPTDPLAQLSQTFSDVAGATYTLTFYAYDGGAAQGDANAFLLASVDGVGLVAMNDTIATYTQETATFLGTGSDTLTFAAQTNPSEWFVDDVSVVGQSAVTPEPGSMLLLGSGLLALGGYVRRRRLAS